MHVSGREKGRAKQVRVGSEGGNMACKLLSANAFGTRPGPQETRHLAPPFEAPNHRKIRKQGVVVPGYATVDGAGLGAFAGMLPADQCAQQVMCAFKDFPHQQDRDAL